jgi:DMSO/TMAO reductase YedYZ molybdopterin-dependent catalytic subunit
MIALLLLSLAAVPDAGVASLQLEGDLVTPTTLTVKALAALPTVPVEWNDKSGHHTGTGVRLDTVLLQNGFSEGPMGPKVNPKVKHQGLRAVVIASAPDGYEAVFSVGELLLTLGATNAVVVWEMDGQPLPREVGPFRLVVSTDKGSSRSIHQVAKLRVVDLKAK